MPKLTKKQINTFKENGYLLVRNFTDLKLINKGVNWLNKIDLKKYVNSWTEKEPLVDIAVLSSAHNTKSPISDISKDDKILKFASDLLGHKTYLWASKVNMKESWFGTVEYFHQDLIYWYKRGYKNNDMMSCMIFLDEHNHNNACLNVFPKSHTKGLIKHEMFININGLQKYTLSKKMLDNMDKKYGVKKIIAKPGDALFFHSNLVHGSSHNLSSKSRRILLAQINADNNKPINVEKNAKNFNLLRSRFELKEAKRRYKWFESKVKSQSKTKKINFLAPIPKEERN